ncbi:MAG: universal stress protein, partial [Proteobacteria bacterium]|nr:universal stress protein [Pseudomonadota bacterium]
MENRNVLIALDLTQDSDAVMDAAKNLIDDSNTDVTLVTVVEPLSYAYTGVESAPVAQALLNLTGEASKICRAKLDELAARADFRQVVCHVLSGHPASEIAHAADEVGADLIIIGSHARQ